METCWVKGRPQEEWEEEPCPEQVDRASRPVTQTDQGWWGGGVGREVREGLKGGLTWMSQADAVLITVTLISTGGGQGVANTHADGCWEIPALVLNLSPVNKREKMH